MEPLGGLIKLLDALASLDARQLFCACHAEAAVQLGRQIPRLRLAIAARARTCAGVASR